MPRYDIMWMGRMRHGFRFITEKCDGHMQCMRICPTQAIRVKGGKARLIPELCIDCGECLTACPTGAITATTTSFGELDRYRFKVAIPAPAFFAQFSMEETPYRIAKALIHIGFDAVWDYSVDTELISRAIVEFVKNWKGPFPLISNSCPVVVRLVQVAYPSMVRHLLPMEAPREIAAREIKRKYSKKLGLKPEEIAAVYITPCQAKSISILEPAEGGRSYINETVGIRDIYNDIQQYLLENKVDEDNVEETLDPDRLPRWGAPEGEFQDMSSEHYIPLIGLSNIINVFDDIERGKIRNIEFLECHSCQGGCIGGNLTVENLYVARAKKLHLLANQPSDTKEFLEEVERRYQSEDFSLKAPVSPRTLRESDMELKERVERKHRKDEVLLILPDLDCGLCGAPRCHDHAIDVAAGEAEVGDCVFLSEDRIDQLRKRYLDNKSLSIVIKKHNVRGDQKD